MVDYDDLPVVLKVAEVSALLQLSRDEPPGPLNDRPETIRRYRI